MAIKRKRSRKSIARSFELPRRSQPAARTNDSIRAANVRLIGEDGTQLGIRALDEALRYADNKGLDLVEVAATDPPVCRVMDYAKFRYQEEQKAKLSRKKQTQIISKEIRVRPKIGEHDYAWKRRQLLEFLEQRTKVKIVVLFRGREREHPERARDLLRRFAIDAEECGVVEAAPLVEGRSMTMVLAPRKER